MFAQEKVLNALLMKIKNHPDSDDENTVITGVHNLPVNRESDHHEKVKSTKKVEMEKELNEINTNHYPPKVTSECDNKSTAEKDSDHMDIDMDLKRGIDKIASTRDNQEKQMTIECQSEVQYTTSKTCIRKTNDHKICANIEEDVSNQS